MQRREDEQGLSDEAAVEMDAKRAELSEARKARDPNLPGLATAGDIPRHKPPYSSMDGQEGLDRPVLLRVNAGH